MTMLRILLAVLCTCLFVTCDSLAAHWGKTGRITSLVVGAFVACLAYAAFGWLNKYWPLAQAGVFVNVGIAIGTVLVGLFFFKEELTAMQWWGIAIGLIAIIMVSAGAAPVPK